MNKHTGHYLNDADHLKQSIQDILTTPLGSRVMRRDYGSQLFELIDAPINDGTLLDIYTATAQALYQWEPRLIVQKIIVEQLQKGQLILSLKGTYKPLNETVTLSNLTIL